MNRAAIREAIVNDADGIANVHVAVWNSTYSQIVPQEFLASRTVAQKVIEWRERLNSSDEDPRKSTLVAVDEEDHVIGFCCGGPKRDGPEGYDAEIYAIYVLDSYHGRGVGKDLLLNMMRQLQRRAFKSVMLWALTDNAKAKFYEHCGGMVCGQKRINIGGAELQETAFGWPSIKKVIQTNLHWQQWDETCNISELTRLVRLCYEPHAAAGLRFNATWQEDSDTVRRLSEGQCYVMKLRGALVATITLSDHNPQSTCTAFGDPELATFHQFCVHPDVQHMGLGREIIERIAKIACERGYRKIALDTAEPATALIQYYQRLGFENIGTHQWPTTNYRSVILSKVL